MGTRDERVDAYIAKSADFAKPILEYIRELVHEVCPDVEETIKWGFPCFDYKGPFCSMAAFKAHMSFGFWKHALVVPDYDKPEEANGMGSFGKMTKKSDLPAKKVLVGYIKKAMELNEQGVKVPKAKPKRDASDIVVPEVLAKALAGNKKAKATFDAFAPSHKREYIEWINEAKTEPTREKRLATTLEWLVEGKSRNWKYKNC